MKTSSQIIRDFVGTKAKPTPITTQNNILLAFNQERDTAVAKMFTDSIKINLGVATALVDEIEKLLRVFMGKDAEKRLIAEHDLMKFTMVYSSYAEYFTSFRKERSTNRAIVNLEKEVQATDRLANRYAVIIKKINDQRFKSVLKK